METIAKTFIDKSKWGDGPWQNEPDKIQWEDSETKLPCLAVRHESLGHWCGYVGVTESHQKFGCGFSNSDELNIHGGITFGGSCREDDAEHGICHTPSPSETDKVWWLGFDCAHYDDFSPGLCALTSGDTHRLSTDIYRDLEYVKSECASLAKQLKSMI